MLETMLSLSRGARLALALALLAAVFVAARVLVLALAYGPRRAGWIILHTCGAHPLLGLSDTAEWALRFHDWTAARAWPDDHAPEDCARVLRHDWSALPDGAREREARDAQVRALGGKCVTTGGACADPVGCFDHGCAREHTGRPGYMGLQPGEEP